MKNYLIRLTAVCIAMTLIQPLFFPKDVGAEVPDRPSYLKSATYFSDSWPVNFWNSDNKQMEAELKQIAEDGFNSIILVIPWREFQPDVDSPGKFNTYPIRKLKQIMSLAGEQGLWVTVRLGYTWDYYEVQSPLYRYDNLVSQSRTRKAWLVYAGTIYRTVSSYPNFYGGFITWEDFWNFTDTALSMEQSAARLKAASCGYTAYLQSHYTIAQVSDWYGKSFSQFHEVYLPRKEEPAAKLFYDFYDDFLMNLLNDTREVFPELSMEVRLDQEPLVDRDNQPYYYSHKATYACGSSPYTAAMTSIAMGQKNQSEIISASEGVEAISQYLEHVRNEAGGKKLYIEQFLYMDNTPEFSYNAQIAAEQVPDYITGMAPVLERDSMGYGLWVYRNYGNNQIYNSGFSLGARGWAPEEKITVTDYQGSPAVQLNPNLTIHQSFRGAMRNRSRSDITVRFFAASEQPALLHVTLGGTTQTVEISQGQMYTLEFAQVSAGSIAFQAEKTMYLDDVDVHTFVQNARLYDINGVPMDCLDAVRTLNGLLKSY